MGHAWSAGVSSIDQDDKQRNLFVAKVKNFEVLYEYRRGSTSDAETKVVECAKTVTYIENGSMSARNCAVQRQQRALQLSGTTTSEQFAANKSKFDIANIVA